MRLKKYSTRQIVVVGTSEVVTLKDIFEHVKNGGDIETENFCCEDLLGKALLNFGSLDTEELKNLIRNQNNKKERE